MPMSPRLLRPRQTGFNPRSISGLALWLDAADSSTLFQDAAATIPATATNDPVGAWLDKSGNGRHATQATATRRGAVGSQNGRRAITLDGTDDHFVLGDLSAAFPTAAEVIVAYAVTSQDNGYVIYQTANNTASDVFGSQTYSGAFRSTRINGAALVGPTSGPNLWGVSSSSSAHDIWIQGAKTLSSNPDYSGGASHAIGSRTALPEALTSLTGRFCEVCAFSRVLSPAERQRLNRYLAAKWGITLAPQVSNADAQDWLNRVYAAGGTVSAATANAVNTFCNAIDAAGIRDRFYRLNLFCGNSDASLAAVRTPLYRGPSLAGTQYGNATDTNVNFVSGDYDQSIGLSTAYLVTKYLNTGLKTSDLPQGVIDSGHLSVWHGPVTVFGNLDHRWMGAHDSATVNRVTLIANIYTTPTGEQIEYGKAAVASATTAQSGNPRPSAFLLGQRTSSTNLEIWRDGVVVGTNTASATGIAGIPYDIFVFRWNATGTLAGNNTTSSLRHYSIGDDMTSAQVLAFRAALSAFNTAMGRTT